MNHAERPEFVTSAAVRVAKKTIATAPGPEVQIHRRRPNETAEEDKNRRDKERNLGGTA